MYKKSIPFVQLFFEKAFRGQIEGIPILIYTR